jgi:hypothetical protein
MTQLKKTLLGAALTLSMATLALPAALAKDSCGCDKACMEKCEKGNTQGCECKECKEHKGKGCKDHQCKTHKHAEGHDEAHKH